ncbi:MAG: antitoxin [Chloroflexi bacterium]|nr:antitoxin [Chloroflexota bacterium]
MAVKKKKPLQIYLREDQERALRSIAERRGESMASLVREGVDKLLRDLPADEDPLLDIVGIYDSGVGDLAEKHDEVIIASIVDENHPDA